MKMLALFLLITSQLSSAQIAVVTPQAVIESSKFNEVIAKVNKVYDIGDVRTSLLTETDFKARNGACWVLMNGQSSAGTPYAAITGRATAPNMAGRFLRNAGGNAVALAQSQEDEFKSHNHGGGVHFHSLERNANSPTDGGGFDHDGDDPGTEIKRTEYSGPIIDMEGGVETAPKSLTVNMFMKMSECPEQILPVAQEEKIKSEKVNEIVTKVEKVYDIGEIRKSALLEADFKTRNGACWVLMNGQSVVGSAYQTLTGRTTLPDAAGRFLRNAGGNAAPLAQTQEDTFKAHNHGGGNHRHDLERSAINTLNGGGYDNDGSASGSASYRTNYSGNVIDVQGGVETRPQNLTINMFVKINECN